MSKMIINNISDVSDQVALYLVGRVIFAKKDDDILMKYTISAPGIDTSDIMVSAKTNKKSTTYTVYNYL